MPTSASVVRIISYVVRAARAAGADERSQTQRAVDALLQIRPDIAAREARSLVQAYTQGLSGNVETPP